MEQKPEATRYDRLVTRAKNNPVIAVLLLVGVVLAGIVSSIGHLREAAGWFVQPSGMREAAPAVKEAVPAQPPDEAAIRAQVAASGEGFSPISFREYIAGAMSYMGSTHTDLQRKQFIAEQDGKRVIWSGYVLLVDDDGVTPLTGGTRVALADHYGDVMARYAEFRFGASDKPVVLKLRPGDHVEITGVIDDWDVQVVYLTNSKVLKVDGNFWDDLRQKEIAEKELRQNEIAGKAKQPKPSAQGAKPQVPKLPAPAGT